eukprot:649068-Alexandrium_andersonii.AAC.1
MSPKLSLRVGFPQPLSERPKPHSPPPPSAEAMAPEGDAAPVSRVQVCRGQRAYWWPKNAVLSP